MVKIITYYGHVRLGMVLFTLMQAGYGTRNRDLTGHEVNIGQTAAGRTYFARQMLIEDGAGVKIL